MSKRVHLYVNRKGELTRLVLWGDFRFKSIITGLSGVNLCQAELDSQPSGEVIDLAPDLMSGTRVDFSNRRPVQKIVDSTRVCHKCYGAGKVLLTSSRHGDAYIKCGNCYGNGYLIDTEND